MSKYKCDVDFSVELSYEEGGWVDLSCEKDLPPALLVELAKLPPDVVSAELEFDVVADVSYDPGCRYTKNGDGWPESFSDERSCKGVYLLLEGCKRTPLYKTLADELEGIYQEEINDAELPEGQPEDDRGDYEYDRRKDGD